MMTRHLLISFGILSATLALSMPTRAEDSPFEEKCGSAPFAPDIKPDSGTSDAKLSELKKDVVDFMHASDQFQDCVREGEG